MNKFAIINKIQFDYYKAGFESNNGARLQQSLLMLYPTTPSTPISSGKQKSISDLASYPIWSKSIPSRFPLKLYKFTPKKHQLQELPAMACPTDTPSPPLPHLPIEQPKIEEKIVEQPVAPIETPKKKPKDQPVIPKTVCAKSGSECSEYKPNQPKNKKKKKAIQKQKKKLERNTPKTPRILTL